MTIPTLPTSPNRSQDQATFDTNIAAWIAAIDAWTVAVNALGITTLTGSIQSTPIGNVTPSTGAFTTLSASLGSGSGTVVTFTGDGGAAGNPVLSVIPNTSAAAVYCKISNGGGGLRLGTARNDGLSPFAVGSAYASFIATTNATNLVLGVNNSAIATVAATGLAVTGAISATTTIKTGGYTVATLPAGATGDRAYVTDATTPTYLAALTGGGTVVCPVFKNATAWVSA